MKFYKFKRKKIVYSKNFKKVTITGQENHNQTEKDREREREREEYIKFSSVIDFENV